MRMNTKPALLLSTIVILSIVCGVAILGRAAHSQPPGGPAFGNRRQVAAGSYKHECQMVIKEGYRYITSNGIPDHPTGQFPNRGNPNSISPQNYHFRITLSPKSADTVSRS